MNDTPIFNSVRDSHGYQCSECLTAGYPYLTFTCEDCN